MIYQWGIVESSKAKKAKHGAALVRHEDRGIFRPSYGGLGTHLLAREAVPLLLMSATCRPVAVKAIQTSLKLDSSNMTMLKGKLTRPEIRIIRVTMKCSLNSLHDLLLVYPSRSQTPDNRVVPTLIYSGSKRRTGQDWDKTGPGSGRLSVWGVTRKNGKNQVKQFGGGYQNEPSDDDRMDALAITPVCLRIALAIDNKLGYIPLTSTNSAYLEEKTREVDAGFPLCRCSNCLPEDAKALMAHIKQIDQDNFDAMVLHPVALESTDPLVKKKSLQTQPERYPINPDSLAAFRVDLNEQITSNLTNLASPQQVRETIGGEFTVGLSQCVYDCISAFKNSSIYLNHLDWVKQQEYDAQLIKTPNYKLTPKQIICKKELKAALALQKEEDKREAEAECEALDVHMSDESSEGSDSESSPSSSPSASLE
ncbi:hypothetical protein PCASD_09769 [Puccinia coronata f. sp. avenae]|uniref:Helicase ATP-binding domain-containing protein n=1 Tax=Puccinia coronata f. sp. avenae TaxID=200324 RepID=A0A2N5U6I3_9BASI|nr:hypothetical protein PCASD_09769 [Puccinia coronata f. sp. avenae]